MPSDTPAAAPILSLEERRLAIDEMKARQELAFRERELEMKRMESGWFGRFFSPLTTTILAGILTVAGTVVGSLVQSRNALELERQKQQTELILKMVGVPDRAQARANLDFLVESGLLDDQVAERLRRTKTTPVLPGPNAGPSDSRAFSAVRSDDEMIDLVISWEGGFIEGVGGAPATNGGITLAQLSTLLGREATVEELKALPRATLRDFYRPRLLPAFGIEAPIVRAAFLNLAVWSGPRNAMLMFQRAASKLLGTEVTPDGMLGPRSIAMINSVPDSESFVETANCFMLEALRKNPAWPAFGAGWMQRLRAFSPVTLHGACPALQTLEAPPPAAP